MPVRVTAAGLRRIERHLRKLDALDDRPNARMIERLRAGAREAQDLAFYQHEIAELALMAKGVDARTAHLGALVAHDIAYAPGYEAKLYHSDVIREFSEYFNPAAHP